MGFWKYYLGEALRSAKWVSDHGFGALILLAVCGAIMAFLADRVFTSLQFLLSGFWQSIFAIAAIFAALIIIFLAHVLYDGPRHASHSAELEQQVDGLESRIAKGLRVIIGPSFSPMPDGYTQIRTRVVFQTENIIAKPRIRVVANTFLTGCQFSMPGVANPIITVNEPCTQRTYEVTVDEPWMLPETPIVIDLFSVGGIKVTEAKLVQSQ